MTALFDKANASGHDLARYLRYNVAIGEGWTTGDAEAIADETYPWDQFGFSFDDESNVEGPDCIAMDFGWNLITPRGEPTLDLQATRELWFDCDALDDRNVRHRRDCLETIVTVVSRSGQSLFKTLSSRRINLGWNLEGKSERGGKRLVVTHLTFSGKAVVTEREPGVLVVRILPTDKYDPERLLAVFMGALHRWFQDRAHTITINYVTRNKPITALRRAVGATGKASRARD